MIRRTTPGSRRSFLGRTTGAAAVVLSGGLLVERPAAAKSHLPKLDPDSATAKALDYTHESDSSGQTCANCNFFNGGTSSWGKCDVFPGTRVNADGWCKSWIKQAG